MIYKNDRFLLNGRVYRLLHCEAATDAAWAVDINDLKAWPTQFSWSRISKLKTYSPKADRSSAEIDEDGAEQSLPAENMMGTKSLAPTASMTKVRDKAMELLGNLIDPATSYPKIFDEDVRGPMVLERAQEAGCSTTTIYKHLRRFWSGGQTRDALLGNFHRCAHTVPGKTGGRGAKPEFERHIYQLTESDFAKFDEIIQSKYLPGKLRSLADVHQEMLEKYYFRTDGNGDEFLLSEGERPTYRQLQHYLRKNYPLHTRLRSREGEKDYERDHRQVLGTVMDVCHGVGHYYEADATILDLFLVAAEDIKKIIGKPTLYLVIDRKSRLIVGWYVGLENASWIVAMQAFVSISQDKQSICTRLGVAYDPSDWPAHEVFPKHVLGDRGELMNKSACQLSTELGTTVTNLPSQRPDWKPIVECEIKQTRMILQPGAPGFDPPENAKKRQGKHYDKDACLTLKQLEKIILLAIIAHNRKPLLEYPLTLKEIGNEVQPIPIDLWNHDIVERAGVLPRFEEAKVRMALLPRDEGSVSEEGILFKDCHYSCSEAISKGWFVTARRNRFKVKVAYDRRLVDTIFVFDPDNSGRTYECRLTTRSDRYKGMAFCEVYAVEKIQRSNKSSLTQIKSQVRANFNKGANPEYAAGKKALKDAKLSASRDARKADTKEARAGELQKERVEVVTGNKQPSQQNGNVVAFTPPNAPAVAAAAAAGATSTESATALTPEEKLNQMKQRMLRGQL